MSDVGKLLEAKIERDRWGRPLIVPPEGGEPVAYTRATTFAGALDDGHGLTDWKCRQTAIGLADRQDLRIAVAAHRDDKRELNKICEKAQEASESSAAATVGTAYHRIAEKLDMGINPGQIPDEIAEGIRTYRESTRLLKVVGAEQFVVVDQFKVAGTYDRMYELNGTRYIGDLKTSGNLDFGTMKFAIQLALYSRGSAYNIETGERTPLDVDPDWGLIVHCPGGVGATTLYWIDLEAGWEAVPYCNWVREWRKRKDLLTPFDHGAYVASEPAPAIIQAPVSEPSETVSPFRAPDSASLEEWIATAPAADALNTLWQHNQDLWSEPLTRLAAARKALLTARAV